MRAASSSSSSSSSRFRPEMYEDSLDAGAPARAAPVQQPQDMVSNILAGVEHDRSQRDSRVVLAVFVDNEAGVLNKVSGLLSARGFNIESLTVSPTNLESLSRMTVVIREASEEKAAQAIKQLNDVVNVWAVVDYTGTNSLHVSARCALGAPSHTTHTRARAAHTRAPPSHAIPPARAGDGKGVLHAANGQHGRGQQPARAARVR